jgi:ABC-type lipoprotein release transport system permease subunit
MKLYFRHIFNSVKQKPLQPILIILTVAMSCVLFLMAFVSKDVINSVNRLGRQAECGDSDVSVSVNNGSATDFMSLGDLTDFVGEGDKIWGYYKQSFITHIGDNTVLADTVAADFNNTGYLTKFDFVEKNDINSVNCEDTVIITTYFARKNGLSVGDALTVDLGSVSQTYTVRGIVKESGIFYRNDMMLDIGGITHMIAAQTGLYVIDYDFAPYNYLFIKLADPERAEEVIEALRQSEKFADKTVTASREYGQTYGLIKIENLFVWLFISLLILLALSFIYSTFSISQSKRLYSNALFRNIGASKKQMYFITVCEGVIYGLAGALVSLPVSAAALGYMQTGLNMQDISFDINIGSAFLTVGFGILFAVLSVSVASLKTLKMPIDSMLKGETKYFRLPKPRPVLILACVDAAGFSLFLFFPVKYYYIIGAALFFLTIVVLILVFPYVSRGFLVLLERMLGRNKRQGLLILAVKNSKRNFGIQNFNKIFTVVIAFVLVMSYSIYYSEYTADAMVKIMKCELFVQKVYGMDETDILKLKNLDVIDSVTATYSTNNCFYDNGQRTPVFVVDGDVNDVMNFDAVGYEFDGTLSGNEALIPKSVALEFDKKIGDEITLKIKDIKRDYIIKDLIDTNYNFVIITKEGSGLNCNYLMVDVADGCSEETAVTEIKNVLGENSVIIFKSEEIRIDMIEGIGSFLNLAKTVLALVLMLAFVAISDSLADNYQSRKREFEIFRQTGMSKKELFLTLSAEMGVNIIVSLLYAFIMAFAIIGITSLAVMSYGVNFIL